MKAQRTVMAVEPPYPCGCTIPHPKGIRVCGQPATFGLIYSNMLLPICETCAADLLAGYQRSAEFVEERTVGDDRIQDRTKEEV